MNCSCAQVHNYVSLLFSFLGNIKSFLNGMWIFLLIARPFIKDNEIIDHMVDPLTSRVIYGEIMSLLICG